MLSIFADLKVNSPGKLIDTVHESFINVASDSSPGNDDALPAQDEEGVCFTAAFAA